MAGPTCLNRHARQGEVVGNGLLWKERKDLILSDLAVTRLELSR